jgi:hypothetical protein
MCRQQALGRILILAFVLAVGTVGQLAAFSRDTHYYLTYVTTLGACFDWREAHIIASANRRIDGQSATKAEPNILKTHAKVQWHAFGHDDARLRELWFRALDEPDKDLQLIYLGQFLHFLQDWESHAGYPIGIGHAPATFLGKDPDSWALEHQRTDSMTMATANHSTRFCEAIGRPLDGAESPDVHFIATRRWVEEQDEVLEAIYEISDPRWKARKMGGFTRKGKKILRKNATLFERLIEEYMRSEPGKRVPADFEAGDPDLGLPTALPIRYDDDGIVLNLSEALAMAGQRASAEARFGADDQVAILTAKLEKGNWVVSVQIRNIGNQTAKEGRVGVGVYDPLTDEVLGEEIKFLEAIAPGRELETEFVITVADTEEDVIIVAWLEVDELEQINNEASFIPTGDIESIESGLEEIEERRQAKEFKRDDLEDFTDPKAWITDFDELCVVAWARLDDLDPTRYLAPARYWLEDSSGTEVPLRSSAIFDGSAWHISVLGRTERPAPKVWACFELQKDLCAEDGPSIQPVNLQVSLGTDDVKFIDTLDLEPELAQEIVSICDR